VSGSINLQGFAAAYAQTMNQTASQYERARRPLSDLIESIPADGWEQPSPCEGWAARDVLGHIISTQRDFFNGKDIDLGEAPDVHEDPAAAWREHSKRVAEAISDDAVATTAFDGHFGPTTIGATLEQFYVWDMVVHRWDLARSVGADAGLTDAELDRIEAGAESFGAALYTDGVCATAVEAPADAERDVRVLARLGRRA
jgi:uncharacterized protein (TIGR03086 family)